MQWLQGGCLCPTCRYVQAGEGVCPLGGQAADCSCQQTAVLIFVPVSPECRRGKDAPSTELFKQQLCFDQKRGIMRWMYLGRSVKSDALALPGLHLAVSLLCASSSLCLWRGHSSFPKGNLLYLMLYSPNDRILIDCTDKEYYFLAPLCCGSVQKGTSHVSLFCLKAEPFSLITSSSLDAAGAEIFH